MLSPAYNFRGPEKQYYFLKRALRSRSSACLQEEQTSTEVSCKWHKKYVLQWNGLSLVLS